MSRRCSSERVTGPASPSLGGTETVPYPHSWSPDGRVLAFYQRADPTGPREIWTLSVDESGEYQIYIQPYPGPGAKVTVSRHGGREPVWSHDGRELSFRHGSEVWAASVSGDTELEISEPTLLFDGEFDSASGGTGSQTYDVAADGRFLMVERDRSSTERLIIVQNWIETLTRQVPGP